MHGCRQKVSLFSCILLLSLFYFSSILLLFLAIHLHSHSSSWVRFFCPLHLVSLPANQPFLFFSFSFFSLSLCIKCTLSQWLTWSHHWVYFLPVMLSEVRCDLVGLEEWCTYNCLKGLHPNRLNHNSYYGKRVSVQCAMCNVPDVCSSSFGVILKWCKLKYPCTRHNTNERDRRCLARDRQLSWPSQLPSTDRMYFHTSQLSHQTNQPDPLFLLMHLM